MSLSLKWLRKCPGVEVLLVNGHDIWNLLSQNSGQYVNKCVHTDTHTHRENAHSWLCNKVGKMLIIHKWRWNGISANL